MSEILKICGIAVISAMVSVVIGKDAAGMGTAVRIGGLILAFAALTGLLLDVAARIQSMGAATGAQGYVLLMLRALGICVLCRICSDICRDCGQAGIAGAVESAGKLLLVLMAMPLIEEILGYAALLGERM